MVRRVLIIMAALAAFSPVALSKTESMKALTERVFERAAAQVKHMDSVLDGFAAENPGAAIYPRSINLEGGFWAQ